MSTDKVTGCEGADEGEFASHNGGGDDAGELLSVLARVSLVCALHAEHLQNGLLRCEDGTAADGADFNTRHGYSHEKVFTVVRSGKSMSDSEIRDQKQ